MLNRFARFLLVATSLSPILGAVAVNKVALGKPWADWILWLLAAGLLILVCWLLLMYASKSAQKHELHISRFESSDQQVLAFLLAYLLPFISSENMAFEGQWLTGAYILGVIFLVVSHSGSLHFNPVMGFLGYHFYGVQSDDGVPQLLISRTQIRRSGIIIKTARISQHIYLHTENAYVE